MTYQEMKDKVNKDNKQINEFLKDLNELRTHLSGLLKCIGEVETKFNKLIEFNNESYEDMKDSGYVFTRDLYQDKDKAHLKRYMHILEYELRKFRQSH